MNITNDLTNSNKIHAISVEITIETTKNPVASEYQKWQ